MGDDFTKEDPTEIKRFEKSSLGLTEPDLKNPPGL